MSKRGKVLRDPYVRPGLLIVEGQQHQFFLEGVWRSDVPPKPGLVVDVEFNAQGEVSAINAVAESQIAREQAEMALAAAKKKGSALASTLVAKFGLSQLVAAGLLLFSWSFLTAVSVQLPFPGRLEFTFWQVLGYLNSGNLSQALDGHRSVGFGFYNVLSLVAICGPFLHHFWKDKRAAFGGLLPFTFMLVIWVLVRSNVQSSLSGPSDGLFGNLQQQAQEELMKAISLGIGAYVSMLVSLYFAGTGVKGFLAAKRSEPEALENAHKAAA
jgi:hypothetical protein